jgi:hypothetical protein
MDVLNAGAGNDTIAINASNIAALATNNQIIQGIAVDIACGGG